MQSSKINRENFLTIQGFMVTDLHLKGNELLVYAIIYGFCQDGENHFTGSIQYLADWLSVTRQTIMNVLNDLVSKGIIEKIEILRNGVKFCEYSVNLTGSQKILLGGSQNFLPNNIDKDNKDNKKEIYKEKFEEWWREYPRKVSKLGAMKAFEKVLANKSATFEDILSGVKRYAWHCRVQKTEDQYIKHPATWLNQGCWIDVYNDRPSDEEYATWKFKPKNPETETDWDFWRVMNEDEKNG